MQFMCVVGAGARKYFLDRRTKLRLSECVEVYLHTKRAGAGSTKLKEHKVASSKQIAGATKLMALPLLMAGRKRSNATMWSIKLQLRENRFSH